jgi:cell wall-associated NlpC family hydrolase
MALRRLLPVVLLAALLVPAAPASAKHWTLGGWDARAQRLVARAGILGAGPGANRLTVTAERGALRGLARKLGTRFVDVSRPPTVASFDGALVAALGLSDLARSVQHEARRAGLRPPARFGTEVVARRLGLRHDFPAVADRLELYPSDRITRAEAAWSFAVVLRSGPYAGQYARDVLSRFHLPRYSAAQRAALRIAVSRIGYPYVWGGETDTASNTYYGPQAHGGYDCSGFVWRVFKLSGLPAGRKIGGRTADAMAREFPRRSRIAYRRIRAGDLLFFGTPKYISHVTISMGNGFLIESSGQGVAVAPLWEGWRVHEFQWARRIL